MDCRPSRTKDPDDWLATCPDFSRGTCETLREWINRWEPDLTECIKWNMLCFTGRKLVCAIGAFKQHIGLTFFRGVELPDPAHLMTQGRESNTSILTVRMKSLDDIKAPALRKLLHAAVALDAEPFVPPPPKVKREPMPIPDDLARALTKHPAAARGFESFAPTYQREYIVWVSTAKRPETRERRLAETIAALKDGRKWIERKG